MKRKIIILSALLVFGTVAGLLAADHIDSPSVTNQTTDITDLYVFKAADPNNLVFVANTQGLLAPSATGTAKFDANTLIEFNIDTNNDNLEDLVLQAKADGNGNMLVYGPVAPSEKGARSRVEGTVTAQTAITTYGASTPIIGTGATGIKVFAGPRDDPFFFDLNRFKMILAGTAPGFNNPGTDSFAGTNVLSVVIELPKSLLGMVTGGKVNVWLETKKKI
jgi:hypothetical protein